MMLVTYHMITVVHGSEATVLSLQPTLSPLLKIIEGNEEELKYWTQTFLDFNIFVLINCSILNLPRFFCF